MDAINFKNDGGPLFVGFQVINDCKVKNYSIELYSEEGNKVVAVITKENTNSFGFKFPLPAHAFQNNHRVLTCTVKFDNIDVHEPDFFHVGMALYQDGKLLDLIEKEGELNIKEQMESLLFQLIGE
ncbi:MAG: hypothetical protein PHH37_05775 [Paludibacter sp.]|nr:hypothetical protein [Paludibacter sp.]